jgi:hypothetical protein
MGVVLSEGGLIGRGLNGSASIVTGTSQAGHLPDQRDSAGRNQELRMQAGSRIR